MWDASSKLEETSKTPTPESIIAIDFCSHQSPRACFSGCSLGPATSWAPAPSSAQSWALSSVATSAVLRFACAQRTRDMEKKGHGTLKWMYASPMLMKSEPWKQWTKPSTQDVSNHAWLSEGKIILCRSGRPRIWPRLQPNFTRQKPKSTL